MTTTSQDFPRYFKALISEAILRFDNSSYGTFTSTGRVSDYWVLVSAIQRDDLFTEIPESEAIALLTARNGGGE